MRRFLCGVTLAAAAWPAGAAAQGPTCPIEGGSTHTFSGHFGPDMEGAYVLVPFEVPAGTTAVRVRYCFDQPQNPTSSQLRHTLDLGLYQARADATGLWGEAEFRGWGGSSHPEVVVSPEGFKSEAAYRASPRTNVAGKTTRGFRPGPIPAGKWAAELGVASVVGAAEGDEDDGVAWRVEVQLSADPAFADEPYQPTAYDSSPARSQPGWYAGDFHVHAEHSALGDATMTEVFDFAFRPLADGGAGLDWVNLSDYVTDSAWGEIRPHQDRHPGKAIVRSSEVITYRGHFHNNASLRYVDYRTGPVHEWNGAGTTLLRGPRPVRELFADIRNAGGFVQINHPTIFPSTVPGFSAVCRGCPWDHPVSETEYGLVDAIEVATGPAGANNLEGELGPSPFVVTAISFWEDRLDAALHIAATGSSDSHNAGRTSNAVTQTPLGEATTVVFADELSEKGIQRAVEAGHTYVKLFGNKGPDLRFEARAPGRPVAIMGDAIDAPSAELTARVLNAGTGPFQLQVLQGRVPLLTVPVPGPELTLTVPSVPPGRYRLQLMRGTAIESVSSPIWVGQRAQPGPGPPGGGGGSPSPGGAASADVAAGPLRVSAIMGSHSKVRRGRVAAGCRVAGAVARECVVRLVRQGTEIGSARGPVVRGRAMMKVRLNARGLRLLRGRRALTPVLVDVSAVGAAGGAATTSATTRLRPLPPLRRPRRNGGR